ncbi:unnamed protein product [Spirodela intermedia]|uniref:PORR domain-containing protein n=1 Tax=Spirodela intermedia TaxID=51605 RepID=A0A7I8JM95_SPIIN|nr:unnamed protein product [Spirodela intermedia]CAA6671249.1 unnamed protein product [Spirodela intermedia]
MKKDPVLEKALSRNRLRQKRFKTLDLQGGRSTGSTSIPAALRPSSIPPGAGRRSTVSPSAWPPSSTRRRSREAAEMDMARRLAKVLMLVRDHRLNVTRTFRIVNEAGGGTRWRSSSSGGTPICVLPIKSRASFDAFNEGTPYASPYSAEQMEIGEASCRNGPRAAIPYLWKKLSIVKLGHFRREFSLPERLGSLLLRHLCIFYVSNRYKIYTALLREGYDGSELMDKHPCGRQGEAGELMQEGLTRDLTRRGGNCGASRVYQSEERRRFYKALFDDPPEPINGTVFLLHEDQASFSIEAA